MHDEMEFTDDMSKGDDRASKKALPTLGTNTGKGYNAEFLCYRPTETTSRNTRSIGKYEKTQTRCY